jgi:putative hydrolase of the HAD superfamily
LVVILDFAGVLTSNMVEVIDLFEVRERLPAGRFLRAWASPEGQELYRRLELGRSASGTGTRGSARYWASRPRT